MLDDAVGETDIITLFGKRQGATIPNKSPDVVAELLIPRPLDLVDVDCVDTRDWLRLRDPETGIPAYIH
jgi:hypothetical protein